MGSILYKVISVRRHASRPEDPLKCYSAIVDYEKLGYELTVVTEVTVSKANLSPEPPT
jgi:hypothetical protein